MNPCPHCAESMQDAAVVCPHCGRSIYRTQRIRIAVAVAVIEEGKRAGWPPEL